MAGPRYDAPRRRRQTADDARFRRPDPSRPAESDMDPVWAPDLLDEPEAVMAEDGSWEEPSPEEPPFASPDEAEAPFEPDPAIPEEPEQIASNRLIRLTCTLAAMCSPFALFLLFAEKESRAVRLFSLQSVILAGLQLALGLLMAILGTSLGGLPYLGTAVAALCWIVYLCGLIACLWQRVRLMLGAWQGFRVALPLVGFLAGRLDQPRNEY